LAETVGHKESLVATVAGLLREVVRLSDMLFVMSKGPSAVIEAWVDVSGTKVSVKDEWLSVESEPWHCHLNLAEIAHVRFVEEPDVHDRKRQAFSIRLLGADEEALPHDLFRKDVRRLWLAPT